MTIDMKKTYRTRDGREVEVYRVEGPGAFPVIAAYKDKDGMWWPQCYRADGQVHGGCISERDLIEVRPRIKREVWVNVYPGENTHWVMHLTKESADRQSMPNRIACVKLTIDCEEGEGLSNGYCEYGKGLSNG